MAFDQQVTIPGDATYRLSPQIKKYTLGDLGFITNNAGAYTLHRSLEPEKALANAVKLKVTVNPDLTGFKMSTVSAGMWYALTFLKINMQQKWCLCIIFLLMSLWHAGC